MNVMERYDRHGGDVRVCGWVTIIRNCDSPQ